MLEFLRRRVFPFAVWCGVMGTAGWLWTGLHSGSARGYVEGVAYDVTSLAPGRIASVAVLPGQQVRAGQLIAMIDPETFQYRVRQSQADVDASQAAVLTAQAGTAAALLPTKTLLLLFVTGFRPIFNCTFRGNFNG